ncbi:porin [Methyloversatilis thermotolerans]|uniref:porin n=1 Tax=Methyloversatilis thermotolerans TaxID=1346290 RepID=UPI00037021D1|nr:porin [Methyloversatilis thermotolerans]
MSKKLLAAAIAAALAPAAVMAESSNVTIYGRIDYGFVSRGGTDGTNGATDERGGRTGRLNEMEDGIAGGNRLGFRGKEDLGNGLKAIFEIEMGFAGDTNATFNSNRHSWVGLEGAFGTVLGGRVDGARYSFVGQYDPFKNQTVGNAASVFGATSNLGQADRADNAIVYITPELAPGLKFLAAYTTSLLGEEGRGFDGASRNASTGVVTTSSAVAAAVGQDIETGDTPLYAIAALYNNGPISLTLDYENLQIKRANSGNDLEFDLWVVGASYDFGVAKLSAYYENVEGDDSASKAVSNSDGWLIGVTAPVTANIALKASYVSAEDKRAGAGDCDKWAFGGEYTFSKRTMMYATYARLSNDRSMSCALTTAGNRRADVTTGSGGAYGDSGFNLGIAHTF